MACKCIIVCVCSGLQGRQRWQVAFSFEISLTSGGGEDERSRAISEGVLLPFWRQAPTLFFFFLYIYFYLKKKKKKHKYFSL
jgi:hypothetical protein